MQRCGRACWYSRPGIPAGQRYRVLELISEGGFGTVYLARDEKKRCDVAVKIPHGRLSDNMANEVTQRESDALSRLHSPRIANRLNTFVTDNRLCIVTEWIDGISLDKVLQEGPLDVDHALVVAREICEGLQHAHEHGVIHRDIKPHNIMITKRGHARILDFGLARILDENGLLPGENSSIHGQLKGSLAYMSPEQARGMIDCIDEKSDVFSVGIVLYELLTGVNPFQQDGQASTDLILNHDPVFPSCENELVPEWLDRIVMRALQKNRLRRIPSAAELLRQLEVPSQRPVVGVPAPRAEQGTNSWLKYFGVALLTVAACLVVYFLAGLLGNPNQSEQGGNQIADGAVFVKISTVPRGGEILAYPISEDDGEPEYDQGILGASTDFERYLEPGRYLFVARMPDDHEFFHEVFRWVPDEKQASIRNNEMRYKRIDEGVELYPIKLFSDEQVDLENSVQSLSIYFDSDKALYDDAREVFTSSPVNIDGFMARSNYIYASNFLENRGKRLPFMSELIHLAELAPDSLTRPESQEWTSTISRRQVSQYEGAEVRELLARSFKVWSNDRSTQIVYPESFRDYENLGFRGVRRIRPKWQVADDTAKKKE